jgi:hypothetical protein
LIESKQQQFVGCVVPTGNAPWRESLPMMLFFGIVVGPDRFGDINNGALPVGITAPYPKFNHDFICMFDRIKLSMMIGKGALSQLSSGMAVF